MDRTTRRGVLRRTSIIVALGLAALACIKWMQAHELLLTTVAHPVTNVNAETEHTCWLSDHQLLITTTHSVPVEKKAQQSAPPPKNWRESIDLLDTATGRRDHLTALADLLNRTLAAPLEASGGFTVSPDRTWLVWDSHQERDGLPELDAAHPDGSGFRIWKTGHSSNKLFLDNRHLLLQYDTTFMSARETELFTILDLQDPTQEGKISKPEQKVLLARYAAQSPVFITVSEYVRLEKGAKKTAEIETYGMQDHLQNPRPNTVAPVQQHWPTFPAKADFQAAYVSPQKRFILYHLMVARTSPLFAWLHRKFSNVDVKPTQTEELWVSRVDGSGIREIGHEPHTMVSEIDPNSRIENVQWLPDGKRVSFAYGGRLYLVPAEPEK